MRNLTNLFLFFLLILFTTACSENKQFNIGVSQGHVDKWSKLMHEEFSNEAKYFGDINVELKTEAANSEQQIADIEEFINQGKDLIVVCASDKEKMRPVIEKAYDKGIPVVLADRRIDGNKYTAFIGVDNVHIGEQMGEFLIEHATERKGDINVVELIGCIHSTTADDRHEGFNKVLSKHNSNQNASNKMNIVGSAVTEWSQETACKAMDSLLSINPRIDYVYAHSDVTAKGAYDAIKKAGREKEIKILGVDALPVEGGGADMVMQGQLLATHTNPINGAETFTLVRKILNGAKFERSVELATEVVDITNAKALKQQYESAKKQEEKFLSIEALADEQSTTLNKHKWMFAGNVIIIILAVLVFLTQHRVKKEIDKTDEMMMMHLQMQIQETAAIAIPETVQEPGAPTIVTETVPTAPVVNPFFEEVKDIIVRNIGKSNFSVNDIADELGISRVQLYRKIKSHSEQGVSDLIRKARLERAHELLTTTNKTISEVAFKVGFSSPSYFTKCFKEYYGHGPSEV